MVLDGTIDVSGRKGGDHGGDNGKPGGVHTPWGPGGGGAGGSVWIEVAGTFEGSASGRVVANGGDGGLGQQITTANNNKDEYGHSEVGNIYTNTAGGGGGGRISIVGAATNNYLGSYTAVGGSSYVHNLGAYGYRSLPWDVVNAFPTGGGGAGTVHVQNANTKGDVTLDNNGVTSDHPTSLYNHHQYNVTLDELQLRGNTSLSLHADGVVAVISMNKKGPDSSLKTKRF
jgi:hypothetical protein